MQTYSEEMRPIGIVCILLILAGLGQGGDIIFFADDHYKSNSDLTLNASVKNPAHFPGMAIIKISLANQGKVQELIPISSGLPDDILLEMSEEMNSSNALEITAVLEDTGPFLIASPPQHIPILPGGEARELQFAVTIDKRAYGWYELPLRVDYVRQVDVSVNNSEIFPLRQPLNQTLKLRVYVRGNKDPLRICMVESGLTPGRSDVLWMVIENTGEDELEDCSASLLASPPFHAVDPDFALGDLAPGDMALARFQVYVDGNASQEEYHLGCRIRSGEVDLVLPFALRLNESNSFPWHLALIMSAFLAAILGAFGLRRQKLLYRWKRWIKRH